MIVDELIKLQKEKNLTNQQFADSIGIHKQSWYRNKRTKKIRADIFLDAVRVYPELQGIFKATYFIKDDKSKPYETHQNRNLTDLGHRVIVSIKKRFLHH